VSHRHQRHVLAQGVVQFDQDVPVESGFEVVGGAADAVEHCALAHRFVVNRGEPALGQEHRVDDDAVAAGRATREVHGRLVREFDRSGVDDGPAVTVDVRTVFLALTVREVVRLVVVRVLVGHRHERRVAVDGVVQFDSDVLVNARGEVLGGTADALEHCALGHRRVVDGDEATLGEFHAVDQDARAVGRLVAHRDRRRDGEFRLCDDCAAVVGVRSVRPTVVGEEVVHAVTVRVLVGHRDVRSVLGQRLLQVDGDVVVGSRFEVLRRADDATERVAIGDTGVVNRHEPTVGHRHRVDDDSRPAGRLVGEGHVSGRRYGRVGSSLTPVCREAAGQAGDTTTGNHCKRYCQHHDCPV